MIKSIHAKNLFSWKKLDFVIPTGLSQIIGYNLDDGTLEGVGKSSVFNIATWTLYGKITKEALVDECIMEGQKDAEGCVVLNSGTKVIRRKGTDHGLFLVDPSGKQSKTSNDEIVSLVMSFEMFCQTVYFAQNYSKKFIQADEETKAKILTEARDLKVYDFARKLAEDKMRSAQDSLDAARVYLKDYGEQLLLKEKDETWIAKQIAEFDIRKQDTITRIVSKMDELRLKTETFSVSLLEQTLSQNQLDLSTVQLSIVEANSLVKSREVIIKTNAKIVNDLTQLEIRKDKVLKEISEAKSDNCPVCNQSIELDKLEHYISDKHSEHTSILEEITLKKSDVQVVPNEVTNLSELLILEIDLKNKIKENQKRLSELVATNASAAAYIQQLEDLKKQRIQAKALTPDAELQKQAEIFLQAETLREKVLNKSTEVSTYSKQVSQYDELRKSFKQIKSDIFKTALAELTRNTNEYLREMFDNPVKIRFENVIERKTVKIKTFVTINKKERSLGLYSGGQFRRIAICTDLALSKMVSNRSSKPFNLRFMDEPCKDLSAHSKEKFMSLIRRLPGNTILVEHDKEITSSIDQTFCIDFKDEVSVGRQQA